MKIHHWIREIWKGESYDINKILLTLVTKAMDGGLCLPGWS